MRLLVDAEHSYFQPAIDNTVTELQRQYNRAVPRIYNTIQVGARGVGWAWLELELGARGAGARCKAQRGEERATWGSLLLGMPATCKPVTLQPTSLPPCTFSCSAT